MVFPNQFLRPLRSRRRGEIENWRYDAITAQHEQRDHNWQGRRDDQSQLGKGVRMRLVDTDQTDHPLRCFARHPEGHGERPQPQIRGHVKHTDGSSPDRATGRGRKVQGAILEEGPDAVDKITLGGEKQSAMHF